MPKRTTGKPNPNLVPLSSGPARWTVPSSDAVGDWTSNPIQPNLTKWPSNGVSAWDSPPPEGENAASAVTVIFADHFDDAQPLLKLKLEIVG